MEVFVVDLLTAMLFDKNNFRPIEVMFSIVFASGRMPKMYFSFTNSVCRFDKDVCCLSSCTVYGLRMESRNELPAYDFSLLVETLFVRWR